MTKIENIQKHTCNLFLMIKLPTTKHYEINQQTHDRIQQLPELALEVFRSINKINTVYVQNLLEKNVNSKRYKDNLKVHILNSVIFGV